MPLPRTGRGRPLPACFIVSCILTAVLVVVRACPDQQPRTTKRACKGYCHGGGIGWADSFAVETAAHGKVG